MRMATRSRPPRRNRPASLGQPGAWTAPDASPVAEPQLVADLIAGGYPLEESLRSHTPLWRLRNSLTAPPPPPALHRDRAHDGGAGARPPRRWPNSSPMMAPGLQPRGSPRRPYHGTDRDLTARDSRTRTHRARSPSGTAPLRPRSLLRPPSLLELGANRRPKESKNMLGRLLTSRRAGPKPRSLTTPETPILAGYCRVPFFSGKGVERWRGRS